MKPFVILTSIIVLFGLSVMCPNLSIAQSYQNDVGAYSPQFDGNLDCLAINVPIGVSYIFRNFGSSDQTNVKVYIFITGPANDIIYRDSGVINNWLSGSERTVSFNKFKLTVKGKIDVYAYTTLANDENRGNDTVSTKALMVTETDLKSILVLNPPADTTISRGSLFRPQGCFVNAGALDLYDVPVRVDIRRCADNTLVFRTDTIIDALYIDSPPTGFLFPSRQGIYDTKNLASGCYQISVIGRVSGDGDQNNNTAYSQFTISNSINDNISAVQVISPVDGSAADLNTVVPITIRFKNTGLNSQATVELKASITDWKGKSIYEDAVIQKGWSPNQQYDIQFKNFTPSSTGTYYIIGIAGLATDQISSDNSKSATLYIGKNCDVATTFISIPTQDQVIDFGAGFTPQAAFSWEGYTSSQSNIPVYLEIWECNNNNLVYQTDTTIAMVTLDNPNMPFTFSDRNASRRIAELPSGCYILSIRTRLYCDQNNLNDMKTVPFTIGKSCDVSAVDILNPPASITIPYNTGFIPICDFQGDANFGEQADIPVRAQIRRCTDMTIVWQADSTIPMLNNTKTHFHFSQGTGEQSLSRLAPGCYDLCVFSRLDCDQNKSNDTACANFTIGEKASANNNSYIQQITLNQNIPNPFTVSTTITYTIPDNGRIAFRIVDITGRTILTEITSGETGEHKLTLELHDLPSGVYIYELNFTNANGAVSRLEKMMSIVR